MTWPVIQAASSVASQAIRRAGSSGVPQRPCGKWRRRNLWVASLLGAVHLAGSAAVIVGLFLPVAGVAGGAVEAAAFGWVLSRQLRYGDRGRVLGAYTLFTSLALAMLIVDALRL
jgi:hypothetical protein